MDFSIPDIGTLSACTNISDVGSVVVYALFIIQLMHSFEVNIRICQPENSDVYRGEAEVNITFEG